MNKYRSFAIPNSILLVFFLLLVIFASCINNQNIVRKNLHSNIVIKVCDKSGQEFNGFFVDIFVNGRLQSKEAISHGSFYYIDSNLNDTTLMFVFSEPGYFAHGVKLSELHLDTCLVMLEQLPPSPEHYFIVPFYPNSSIVFNLQLLEQMILDISKPIQQPLTIAIQEYHIDNNITRNDDFHNDRILSLKDILLSNLSDKQIDTIMIISAEYRPVEIFWCDSIFPLGTILTKPYINSLGEKNRKIANIYNDRLLVQFTW